MEQRSPDSTVLVCCATLEWLNSQNSVSRRTNFKNVTLRLIRNQFREIFIELKSDKTTCKYHLKGISVHKKFMAQGKASINFSEQNLILFIFNAPPTQLLAFLRNMFIKLSGDSGKPKVGLRAQLLSSKQCIVQEISPVTLQEVNQVKQKVGCSSTTPPGSMKRALQRPEAPSQVCHSICLKNIGCISQNSEKSRKSFFQGKKARLSISLGPGSLTQEQKNVLNAALSGKNIFFTGL